MNNLNSLHISDNNDVSVSYCRSKVNSSVLLPVSIDELNEIYQQDPLQIFKYNTLNCLSFITSKHVEIPLCEFFNYTDEIMFLKVSSDKLKETDNEILINCINTDHLIQYCCWEKTDLNHIIYKCTVFNGTEDLNGFDNCKKVMQMIKKRKSLVSFPSYRQLLYQKYQKYQLSWIFTGSRTNVNYSRISKFD